MVSWKNLKSRLGKMSVDSDFEDDWREVVERKVSIYGSLSEMHGYEVLDRE